MDYNTIEDLFPRKLKELDTFSILVNLASNELANTFDLISIMSTLSNIDRCPEEFISHLSDLIDFDFSPILDSSTQREAMKLYREESKNIGSIQDLEMMATYGDIEGYKGGNLFIPGTYEERPKAKVYIPRNQLFTFSGSKFSDTDRIPDNIVYKDGTIMIEVTRLNSTIMDRVEKVKPAGMLIVYKYIKGNSVEYVTHTRNLREVI